MSWGDAWILTALALPLGAVIAIRWRGDAGPRLQWPALKRVAITGQRIRAAMVPRLHTTPMLLAAVALTIIALARPLWGEREGVSFTHSREVTIALDLSQSMLTEDVQPSRLERAKAVTHWLLDGLQGESVSLVVFAGTAFVQVPLSPDHQIIREFLPILDTDYMPHGGSNFASMLDAGLDAFSVADDRDRYLIVLSDGESSTGGWQSRLDELVKRSVHVLAFGLGTDTGGFIVDPVMGGYLADRDGNPVHSRLMPTTLQTLASRTHGRYLNAAELTDPEAVRAILASTVEEGRRGRVDEQPTLMKAERFQWFLLPAILLGFCALFLEFPRQPRPRQVRPIAAAPSARPALAATVMLLGAILAPPAADAHYDDEAGFDVRVLFDSDPVGRVRAIAAHLAEFDYDAFDLRLMVEASIRYGADSQRTGTPVEAGVIRDAMEASIQGERLDAEIADWSYYRAQLDRMLESFIAAGEDAAADDRPRELMDEEDSQPVVAGQSTQQSANDSFGQGASGKTDAALGDLSPDQEITVVGRRRPPPATARTAGVRSPQSDGARNDPILAFTLERLETVVRRDSPGRLHQLMVEDTAQQHSNEFAW